MENTLIQYVIFWQTILCPQVINHRIKTLLHAGLGIKTYDSPKVTLIPMSTSFDTFLSTSFDTHHVNGGIQLCKMPLDATGVLYNHTFERLVASQHSELPALSSTQCSTSPNHRVGCGCRSSGPVTLNWRMLAVIGYEENHTNRYLLTTSGTKRIKYRYHLSGEVLFCVLLVHTL